MNLRLSLGLTFSIFAITLIVTSGGLLQSFGSSIEESVDEIVESAEEESDEVRDDAEDLAEEAREDSDEEARDRGDEEDENEDADDSDSDNDDGLSSDPEFPERVLGDNIDDERSNLVSEIEDNVREIKEKIREGTNPSGNNPSIAELFEMQMLMNQLSQISDTVGRVQSASNQAIADLVRGIKG
jgi:vacuolar-type H+-ATPase subunit H